MRKKVMKMKKKKTFRSLKSLCGISKRRLSWPRPIHLLKTKSFGPFRVLRCFLWAELTNAHKINCISWNRLIYSLIYSSFQLYHGKNFTYLSFFSFFCQCSLRPFFQATGCFPIEPSSKEQQ